MDPQGESPRLFAGNSELGVYFNDTRYLGIWEMTINGVAPISLAHELRGGGNTVVFSMTNRDLTKISGTGRIPRDTFLIRRILTLSEDTLFETYEIKNFSHESQTLQLEQWGGGKFDDVFEVRGYARIKRGKMLPAQDISSLEGHPEHKTTVLQYEGLDGVVRSTYLNRLFQSEKIRVSPSLVGHFTRLEIPGKSTALLKTIVSFDEQVRPLLCQIPYGQLSISDQMEALSKNAKNSPFGGIKIESDNAIFNRAIRSAELDIFMLLGQESPNQDLNSPTGKEEKLFYPYAGVPWFSAPFGRDGIITAYQLLPWYPAIARGVLEFVFKTLGTRMDPFTDEQPGKVFHEMRRGEMSKTREIPFIPYYGSVDATPLSLILLHEYIRWTLDLDFLRAIWPQAMRALEWVEKWGDIDQDGFLEYAKLSPNGLVNQGWKDSHDSIMHADGTLARAPIKLCEVQGYAFRARVGMSSLAHLLGEEVLAQRLRQEALELKSRFTESFWNAEGRYIYLALDGENQPCAVRTSNMGQCLWSQILAPLQGKAVAEHLLSDAMFSGYGIRTLSARETSYNPLSYHNGSVWPHDNSLIMEGLRMYGFSEELEKLSMGLLNVLEASSDFRLPELFCGFRRRDEAPPVPYEVACKPQAWAAGAVFLMLKSMLGLSMDADQKYVVFHSPILTPKMKYLEIKGLRGRDWEMDLLFRRGSSGTLVEMTRKSGPARMVIVR